MVVDIEARLELTRKRLELAAQAVEQINPMVKSQVLAVIQPLILAVSSLEQAVEGVRREL